MRYIIITIIIPLLICSCKENVSKKTDTGIDSIAIIHKFYGIPWTFRFLDDGDIFIADNREIARFNNAGKFISSIKLDSINETLTPIIDFIPIDSNQFYASARGNIFYLLKDNVKILNSNRNYSIRIDSRGVLYATFQEFRGKQLEAYNGFRVKKGNGNFSYYPPKYDYGNENFEVIEDKIMFYTGYNLFYILPTDTTKEIQRLKIPEFLNSNERIWFIGMDNNNYVFKYFKNGKDTICFIDEKLRLFKKAVVNYNTSDNVILSDYKNGYYFHNPSGLLYSYNQYDKTIYILKNKRTGIFIYKLDKCLK